MAAKLVLPILLISSVISFHTYGNDKSQFKSMVKISGTDAMFNYDIYTSFSDNAEFEDINKVRPELKVRFCNIVRAWKLEMAQGRILSQTGKQIGAFSATKWDCNQ